MNSAYYEFFDRSSIAVEADTDAPAARYVATEWSAFHTETPTTPVVGRLHITPQLSVPQHSAVLVNDLLYADDHTLYYNYYGPLIALRLDEDGFDVLGQPETDAFKLFYFMEVLLRLHAPRFDIIFLHASAFDLHGTRFVINAFGGTGKTNLLLDVLAAGGTYLADDLIAVDSKGAMYAYPKRINLLYYNYLYQDSLFDQLGVSRHLGRLATFFATWDDSTFVHRLIVRRIMSRVHRRLNTKVPYRRLSPSVAPSGPLDVDRFVWLERTMEESRQFTVDSDYFSRRMIHCLELESAQGADYLGYFSTFCSRVDDLQIPHDALVREVAEHHDIVGIRKKTGDESGVFEMINALCTRETTTS